MGRAHTQRHIFACAHGFAAPNSQSVISGCSPKMMKSSGQSFADFVCLPALQTNDEDKHHGDRRRVVYIPHRRGQLYHYGSLVGRGTTVLCEYSVLCVLHTAIRFVARGALIITFLMECPFWGLGVRGAQFRRRSQPNITVGTAQYPVAVPVRMVARGKK